MREVIERARSRLGEQGQGTILFLDEIHRFNKAQQDALLPERRGGPARADRRHHREPVLRGQPAAALAARPCSGWSRSTPASLRDAGRAGPGRREARPPTPTPSTTSSTGPAATAARSSPPSRWPSPSPPTRRPDDPAHVDLADAEDALGTRALRYGRDDHYDVI